MAKPTRDGTVPSDEPALMRKVIATLFENTPAIRGVEIGCLNGRSAATLLAAHPGLTLTSIDPFIPDSMAPNLIGSEKKARALNAEVIESKRLMITVAYSWDIVETFEDTSLDLVFIDGDHRYTSVKRDLVGWSPKLKPGGLLMMHDCRMSRGGAHFHKGPSQLADKALFGKSEKWKLLGEAFSLAAFQKR